MDDAHYKVYTFTMLSCGTTVIRRIILESPRKVQFGISSYNHWEHILYLHPKVV